MKRNLKAISANYDLRYFADEKNIGNQDLVKETIEYFANGEGKRAFKPLTFLNLLEKQYHFTTDNIRETETVISHLQTLPLLGLEKHILFGLLLKWFGGYPVSNLNEDYNRTLKAIQNEFLSYEGETPEKEFCKADMNIRKQLMKLEISGNAAINSGLDWKPLYNSMDSSKAEKKNSFLNFDALFEEMFKNRQFENEGVKLATRCLYNFNYNVWLQETKAYEYGNEEQYKTFLNIATFQEFLDFEGNKTDAEKYFGLVENEAKIYIDIFNKEYETSGNKERLLQTEIENYEKLFFPESLPLAGFKSNTDNPINGLPYSSIDISDIRDLYQKIIVKGQRNYYANFHNLRLEALVKFYEYLKDMNKKPDPFGISYSSKNSIKFRDEKVFFPFDCYKLFVQLGTLHEKLNDKNVCATDLQSFPQEIFSEPELKDHPEISKWIYNIIYTWICDCEEKMPTKSKRLFDEFLNLCKEKALLNVQSNTKENVLNDTSKGTNKLNSYSGNDEVKKISNSVKALFCFYINDAGIMKKRESENLETYCKKVCEKYKLKYAVRVNKGFYNSENEDNLLLIKEQILPKLDVRTQKELSQHLEKKHTEMFEKKQAFKNEKSQIFGY